MVLPMPDTILHFAASSQDIILLSPSGKKPIEKEWTTTPSKINRDARGYLDLGYNLGYRIPENILVIDVDPRNGGLASYDKLPAAVKSLPHTVTTPGGGFHIYTTLPPGTDYRLLVTKHLDYPGIDFLHKGKQVVLPGSSLPDGKGWALTDCATLPPPAIPAALLSILSSTRVAPREDPTTPVTHGAFLTLSEVDALLATLPVELYRDNDSWLSLMMACHHASDGEALEPFLAWSIADPLYSDQSAVITTRWTSLKRDASAPITIRTLCRELARHATVPSWLMIRAGLTCDPATLFERIEHTAHSELSEYNVLTQEVESCTDTTVLLTTVAAKIYLSSGISESQREILVKTISKRTGASATSIYKDFQATAKQRSAADPLASDPDTSAVGPDTDTRQIHTLAARVALDRCSYRPPDGSDPVPPVYCHNRWYRFNSSYWATTDIDLALDKEVYLSLCSLGIHATSSVVSAVSALATVLNAVPSSSFDQDPHEVAIYTPTQRLLVLPSGELEVTAAAAKHKNLSTISVSYNPAATPPVNWLRLMDQALTSDHARRTIACAIIYAASPCRPWLRKCVYLYGDARTGKSTILDAIEALLGTHNCSAMSMRQLGSRFGLETLPGRLANISTEAVSRETLRDDVFKTLVSGETISVEPKGKPSYEYRNTAKLLFGANTFPRIEDESDATFNRITVISVPNKVAEEDADTSLGDKIRLELAGVLKWAVDIFLEEYKKDRCVSVFGHDEEGMNKVREWRGLNSPVLRWFEERVDQVPGHPMMIEAAYRDYDRWCASHGHKALNSIHFGRSMKGKMSSIVQIEGKRHYVGLRLKDIDSFWG